MPERRPTWGQLRRFCERQGFRPSTTDHDFYDKVLAGGSTAGTKISFGLAEAESVPSSLSPRIWRRQLRLRAEGEFWRGLEGGPVAFDIPQTEDRHLPEDAIATCSRAEAQRLLNEWYSRDRGAP